MNNAEFKELLIRNIAAIQENADQIDKIEDEQTLLKVRDEIIKQFSKLKLNDEQSKIKVFNFKDFLSLEWTENTPLKCDYPMFDKYELIKKGCITGILGGTGARKSMFLLNLTVRLIKNNYKVLYLIIEGNIKRNMRAIAAQINNISMYDIKDEHYLNNKIYNNLYVAHNNYASITVNDIDEIIGDEKYDVLVLDYITLLDDKQAEMFEKNKAIAEKLKLLAENKNLAVLTAAQSTRGGNTKIRLDREDVGQSFGITMTMDVQLGIIKYKKLEELKLTALDIMKLRDIPDIVSLNEPGEVEGKKEVYWINYTNRSLINVTSDHQDKHIQMIEEDIVKNNNIKGEMTKNEKKLEKKRKETTPYIDQVITPNIPIKNAGLFDIK